MTDSYEIVFQQVAVSDLHQLLELMKMDSQSLSELAVSEDFGKADSSKDSGILIDRFISYSGEICLTGKLHGFSFSEGMQLPLVFLRVIKYGGEVDVELSFDDTSLPDISCVMRAAQKYASTLSKKFDVNEFYGGLEPAVDFDTRYFTGDFLGPLN